MKRKIIKIISASGLAIMMGIGTLFGVVISPMNSTRASTSGSEENLLTPQEQLLAGNLELDPENDPVVYTTDYGLDIKFHRDIPTFNTSSSYGVSGYIYFTMGSYNNTEVKWIIIGKNSNLTKSASLYTQVKTNWQTYGYYKSYSGLDSSDAGTIIKNSSSKGLVYDYLNCVFANAVSTTEIPNGCVLCISETSLYSCQFYSWNDAYGKYEGSKVQSQMSSLYSSGLGLSSTQKTRIQPQSLRSYYYNTYCTSTNQYFFPLASTHGWDSSSYPQAFCVQTYFTIETAKTNMVWWLRTGQKTTNSSSANKAHVAGATSWGYSYDTYTNHNGVRPAFVLKL